MYPSSDLHLNYETDDTVFFFSAPFEPLNNFSAHTVDIWGKVFYTVEHAYQWKKFETTDPATASSIEQAGSPWLAKRLAHASPNRRKDWNEVKVDVMKAIITAKVAQHEDVKEMLLSMREKTIVENSPVDDFWGCGADGTGQNWSGKLLMEIRDEITE